MIFIAILGILVILAEVRYQWIQSKARKARMQYDFSSNPGNRRMKIADLNDQLRRNIHAAGVFGKVVVTARLAQMEPETVAKVVRLVKEFDAFDEDNDPYGEHDCGTVTLEGQNFIFKVDYYDKDMEGGSPDAADPDVTTRVLTVLHAEDY